MAKLTLTLTDKTYTFGKYSDGCATCPPSKTLQRRLTCEEFQVTEGRLEGNGLTRKGYICDDCIDEMKSSVEISVLYEPTQED